MMRHLQAIWRQLSFTKLFYFFIKINSHYIMHLLEVIYALIHGKLYFLQLPDLKREHHQINESLKE